MMNTKNGQRNEYEILAIALLISSGHLVVSKKRKNFVYCNTHCKKCKESEQND